MIPPFNPKINVHLDVQFFSLSPSFLLCTLRNIHTYIYTYKKMSKRPLPSSFEMNCEEEDKEEKENDSSRRPCKIMSLDIITEDEEDKEEEALLDAIYRMTDDEGEGDCSAFVKSLKPYDRIPWIIFCQQLLRDKVQLQMNDESKNCFFARYYSTKDVSPKDYHPYLYMRDSQEYKDVYELLAYYCCKVRAYNSLLILLLSFNVKFVHPNGKECIEQLKKEGEWECLKLLGLIEDENEDCWKWWGKNGFLSATFLAAAAASV